MDETPIRWLLIVLIATAVAFSTVNVRASVVFKQHDFQEDVRSEDMVRQWLEVTSTEGVSSMMALSSFAINAREEQESPRDIEPEELENLLRIRPWAWQLRTHRCYKSLAVMVDRPFSVTQKDPYRIHFWWLFRQN